MTSAKQREVARKMYLSDAQYGSSVDRRAADLAPQITELSLTIARDLALGIPVQLRIVGGKVALIDPDNSAGWNLGD